jgi:hypothetical protein
MDVIRAGQCFLSINESQPTDSVTRSGFGGPIKSNLSPSVTRIESFDFLPWITAIASRREHFLKW